MENHDNEQVLDKPTPKQLTPTEARYQAMKRMREEFRKELEGADLHGAFQLLRDEARHNGGVLPYSSPNSLPDAHNAPPLVPEEFRPDPI